MVSRFDKIGEKQLLNVDQRSYKIHVPQQVQKQLCMQR